MAGEPLAAAKHVPAAPGIRTPPFQSPMVQYRLSVVHPKTLLRKAWFDPWSSLADTKVPPFSTKSRTAVACSAVSGDAETSSGISAVLLVERAATHSAIEVYAVAVTLASVLRRCTIFAPSLALASAESKSAATEVVAGLVVWTADAAVVLWKEAEVSIGDITGLVALGAAAVVEASSDAVVVSMADVDSETEEVAGSSASVVDDVTACSDVVGSGLDEEEVEGSAAEGVEPVDCGASVVVVAVEGAGVDVSISAAAVVDELEKTTVVVWEAVVVISLSCSGVVLDDEAHCKPLTLTKPAPSSVWNSRKIRLRPCAPTSNSHSHSSDAEYAESVLMKPTSWVSKVAPSSPQYVMDCESENCEPA
mmetsp:Transcript_46952/g.110571  ORF Transcript_46952/g.110571 Transcript_46952/m.110571 type:complete len:364 (-) Transcript_46952:645-1736(-)